MALSQWSLLDTCMCALCSVLVITVDWIAARMPIQWARLARLRTRANFCSSRHGKSCLMLGSFLPGTGTGKVIPGNDWIPGSRQKTSSANQRIFLTQGLRCLPSSSFLKIAKETLFIDLTLCEMETVERMALSRWSLLDTCMCSLSSVLVIDMNWIAARTPHHLARLARHLAKS